MLEIVNVNLKVVWSGNTKSYSPKGFEGGIRDSYIIHYVTSGSGYFEVLGRTFHIKAGESFIIYPDTYIKYYPDENDPWDYVWVNFIGIPVKNFLIRLNISKKSPVFPAKETSPESIFNDINKVYCNLDVDSNVRSLRLTGLLHMLLAYYTEHYPITKSDPEHKILERCLQTIEENLSRNSFNVSSLALELNLSRATLFRLFKKNLDMSPIQYINELKITRACRFLKETDLSVKAISNSLGFSNALYFSSFFTQNVGVSPTQFRKNENKKIP